MAVWLVVGRLRDIGYNVLDIEEGYIKRVSEVELLEAIKQGIVGNAHLFGNKIKGTYMSFSKLPYAGESDKRVILYYIMDNDKRIYVHCRADGSNIVKSSRTRVLEDSRDFANVSKMLSKEERYLISAKGLEFPSYTDVIATVRANVNKLRKSVPVREEKTEIRESKKSENTEGVNFSQNADYIKAYINRKVAINNLNAKYNNVPEQDADEIIGSLHGFNEAKAIHDSKIRTMNKH